MVIFNGITIKGQSSEMLKEKGVNWVDSIAYYMEQIRCGNVEAYLNLAECYHQSEENVERRFIKMGLMATMAEMYGVIEKPNFIFSALPDDDPIKVFYDVFDPIDSHDYDKILANAYKLESVGVSRQMADAFIALDQGKKEEGMAIFQTLNQKGSYLAKILCAVANPDAIPLETAKEFPLLYNEMARKCFTSDEDPEDAKQAAMYYRMADEQACLDRTGVKWLLSYYEHLAKTGDKDIDPKEMERLKKLRERVGED